MKDTDTGIGTGPLSRTMLAVFLAVCALYCATPVHNGNFFWHLRNGEDILETGSIRTRDPFTWTRSGETWLQQEWASEVLFAVSWKTLGEAGPVIFKIMAVTLSVFLIAMAAMRRGARMNAVVLSGLLWFALSHGRWIVRPHVVSILMFSLYLYLLARGTGGLAASLAVFIPLQVLWTNAHAGFIMGWFLLGIPVLEGFIRRKPREALAGGAVLGGAVLSSGLHPNGFGSFTYITDFLSRPLFRETIREWWSPFHPMFQPGQRLSNSAVILVVLLAATWFVAARRRRDLGIPRILALAALSVATLLSSRNIDFLALAAVAWVSPLLGRIRPALPVVLLAAAAAVPFITGVPREFGPPRQPGLGVDWSIYPRELAGFLEENRELMEARIFNTSEISGYLEYRLGQDLPLYMDGRCHLYPEQLYARYLLLAYARPEDAPRVLSIMDSDGIDLALYDWPKPGESSAYILSASPHWRPVYWDGLTVVYGRTSFLRDAGFLGRSFRIVDPLSPQALLEVPYYLVPGSWESELMTAASPPMSFQPAIIPAAALLLSRGTLPDTLEFVFRSDSMAISLRSALRGDDPCIEDPRLRLVQAWALAGEGRYAEAMEAAVLSGDRVLQSSIAVISGGSGPGSPAASSSVPPVLVPPWAWTGYLQGQCSSGDSAVIMAASLFVSGMRERSMDSIRVILERRTALPPWGFSVTGGLAALYGLDSLASELGDSAVTMNRNPYTLLVQGKIEGITGNEDRAVELFSQSLEISGEFHEARLHRADHLWRTGALEEAMADYRILEELGYLTPAAEFRLAWGDHLTAPASAAND